MLENYTITLIQRDNEKHVVVSRLTFLVRCSSFSNAIANAAHEAVQTNHPIIESIRLGTFI